MNAEITSSSGNVFADVGFPDADEHQLKARIVVHIRRKMKAEGLTQAQAAERIGLKRPDLLAVPHGKFRSYSVERLTRCLSVLGDGVRAEMATGQRIGQASGEVGEGPSCQS